MTVLKDFPFENGRTAHDKVLCWEKEALVSSASVVKDDAISKAWPFCSVLVGCLSCQCGFAGLCLTAAALVNRISFFHKLSSAIRTATEQF